MISKKQFSNNFALRFAMCEFENVVPAIVNQRDKYAHRKWTFAMRNGFTWGDYGVFSLDDMMEMVKEKQCALKTLPVQKVDVFKLARQQYLEEHPEPLLPLCEACNIFKIHSNPPAFWAKSDYIYCCIHCRDTKGKGHGERCQKCLPVITKKTNLLCLDCEY